MADFNPTTDRLLMNCPACGKMRALPQDITLDVPFNLPPCGHYACGQPFHGVLRDTQLIEELPHV